MKRIKHIYKFILVFGLVGAFSCTDGFEELNKNPNSFNSAPPENSFAGIVKNTLDLVGGDLNDQMYMNYASYYGGKGGQFPHFFYTDAVNGWWQRFYVNILKNTQEIIDNYGDNPDYTNRVYIAKIWKSYVYSVMVSTFGGVPMTDALGDNTTANYDSEEQIYTAILNMLKEAGAGIKPAGDKLSKDPIFNGDNTMWIKFANSLRLKIAMRISTGFPALAQEHASAVLSNEDGLIASNSENILMKWGIEQENWSFNYTRYIFGDPSADVVPYMNFHFLLNLKTYNDPRMTALANVASKPLLITDTLFASGSSTDKVIVRYPIPFYGKTLATTRALDAWNLNGNLSPLTGVDNSSYSRINSDRFMTQDMSFPIITYAEICFNKAEAKLKGWGGSKTAEEFYYAGIDASFAQLGVSGAAAYKAQDGIKWGTSSKGDRDLFGVVTSGISVDPVDKIVRQSWIAMFGQGHDAWCLMKRTRLLPVIPQFSPDGSLGVNYVEVPERMIYATTENGINPIAYAAASGILAKGDNMYSPLKMNKTYTPVDWEALPAVYNNDFAKKWYGNSVDDLIANGISYEIIN